MSGAPDGGLAGQALRHAVDFCLVCRGLLWCALLRVGLVLRLAWAARSIGFDHSTVADLKIAAAKRFQSQGGSGRVLLFVERKSEVRPMRQGLCLALRQAYFRTREVPNEGPNAKAHHS